MTECCSKISSVAKSDGVLFKNRGSVRGSMGRLCLELKPPGSKVAKSDGVLFRNKEGFKPLGGNVAKSDGALFENKQRGQK